MRPEPRTRTRPDAGIPGPRLMPTIFTHALVGYAAARAVAGPRPLPPRLAVVAAVLPVVPDLDVFLVPWFGYSHPLGHRGFSHSVVFALLLGVTAAMACRRAAEALPGRLGGLAILFSAIALSHGVLDAFCDGGQGIPFLMPFDHRRYFFPFRPIPVSPVGLSSFVADGGLAVLWKEALLIWPFAAAAVGWSCARRRRRAPAAVVSAGAGLAGLK